MRVAFVSHSPHLTGAEKVMLNLATALAAGGHADCRIAVHGAGPMLAVPLPARCGFLRIAAPIPWYALHPDGADPRAHVRGADRAAAELAAGLRDWGAEVVVVNTLTNLTGVLAAARLNLPAVAWVHGIIDLHTLPLPGDLFRSACDETILRCAERIACPSRWTADFLTARYGLPAEVVPNATAIPDAVTPPPDDGPTVFCCLNTWDSYKGLFTVIDAAAVLKLHTDRFRVDLYGDGAAEFKAAMRRRVAERGVGDVVRMVGRTTDAADAYARSHALVTASEIDSFGMTVIEAMSHARPVIVSDACGHREIVDGPFGVRVPTTDPVAFAWHMLRVVERPDEARWMGALGRRVARERYGYDRFAGSFADLFRGVLATERGRRPDDLARRYDRCRPFLALAS